MLNPLPLMLIVAFVVLATFGDIQFKEASAIVSVRFAVGSAAYLGCGFVALAAFRSAQWGWVFLAFDSLQLGAGLILSVWLYSEPFTLRRGAAAALLIVAMLLAE